MEPYRLAAVCVAAVIAVSLVFAATQIGSAPPVGATATPAAGVLGPGADVPEVRLGSRAHSGGSSLPRIGTAPERSTLPRLLADPGRPPGSH